jgi:hypothetical protein
MKNWGRNRPRNEAARLAKWLKQVEAANKPKEIIVCSRRLNLNVLHDQMAEDFKDRNGLPDGEEQ